MVMPSQLAAFVAFVVVGHGAGEVGRGAADLATSSMNSLALSSLPSRVAVDLLFGEPLDLDEILAASRTIRLQVVRGSVATCAALARRRLKSRTASSYCCVKLRLPCERVAARGAT